MNQAQPSLQQFLLNQTQAKQLAQIQIKLSSKKLKLNEVPAALFYMKGILFIEIMLVTIGILTQVPLTYQSSLKFISLFILSICAIVVCILGIIGIKNKYIKLYWGIFWWRYAAGFIVAIYAMQQRDVLKLIFLWIALVFIILIAQFCQLSTLYFLFIVLSIDAACIGFLVQLINRQQDTQPIYIDYYFFIGLVIVALIAAIKYIWTIKSSWRNTSQLQKFFSYCLSYLFFLSLVVFVIGIVARVNIPWPILTSLNHFIFIILCVYLFKKLPQDYKFFNFTVRLPFKMNRNKKLKKQKLYQVSLGLLCTKQDYAENIRQSIQGKQLNECICCISEQSTFCYNSCKHACIGANCAAGWLMKNITKCPICRQQSALLIRFQRVNDFQFDVIGKYKILPK